MNVNTFIDEVEKRSGYCEATIFKNGDIEFSVPSHTEYLIKWCENNRGISRDDLYNMIPISASPLHWLVEYTGNISLYKEFCISSILTIGQLKTLKELQIADAISDPFIIHVDSEKSLLDARESKDYMCAYVKLRYVLHEGKITSVYYVE